ncbi:MAG: hypothetical protein NVS2B16_31160 [Chloroflexota bacterium]
MTGVAAPVVVHWVRHGRVASHRGDVPVTDRGLHDALEAGRALGRSIQKNEVVSFHTTDTRRSRETADAMRSGLVETVRGREGVAVNPPVAEFAIRNPDLYLGGRRVEMVSTPEAMAEQLPGTGLGASHLGALSFYPEFFAHRDRIGFWLSHSNPPGEDAVAVARRLMTFACSLRDLPAGAPRRYVCITHSPVLRAFLRHYVLDADSGEPEFLECVDVVLDGDVTIRFRDSEKNVVP